MIGDKERVDDLALFGGTPLFSSALHVGRPNVGDRQMLFNRLNDLLDRKWLTNDGPLVQEFEQRICDLSGVKHCVAMCNATVALEILIKTIGLTGEVILPSFTFIATAHALQWMGVTPRFCDIDPETHNIDPTRAAELINPRTTAIIGVHVWGRPCAIDSLVDLTRHHNLRLLFDAAHAFACSYKGQMIGGFGNAEIFSFHATKFVNSFEGGAVVTNDDALAEKLRLMRNFGFAGFDTVTALGTNGKMNEACAAMGLTCLESLTKFINRNRDNYELYQQQLSAVKGISLHRHPAADQNNYQYVVIEIEEALAGINRDLLDEVLWAENILTRRYFYPGCHRMEPYRSADPQAGQRLQETEKLTERVLCLPTGSAVDPHDIATICRLIDFIIKCGAAIKQRLSVKPIFRHPWRQSSHEDHEN
jgi:dTDP-4-amino-4,6-dideoxygalactose transaminase